MLIDSAEAKERLAAFKELTVKKRRCVIIDPNQTEVTLRVHWLPTFVTESEVESALASLGRLKHSTQEKWRHMKSTAQRTFRSHVNS